MDNSNNLKIYVYESSPNGTNDIIITDSDGTVITSVEEALFGYRVDARDVIGGLTVCFYGESVGYVSNEEPYYIHNHDTEQEEEHEELTLADAIEQGHFLSDLQPVQELDADKLWEYVAVNPMDPQGLNKIKEIKEVLRKAA